MNETFVLLSPQDIFCTDGRLDAEWCNGPLWVYRVEPEHTGIVIGYADHLILLFHLKLSTLFKIVFIFAVIIPQVMKMSILYGRNCQEKVKGWFLLPPRLYSHALRES